MEEQTEMKNIISPGLQVLLIFAHGYPLICVFVRQNRQQDFQLQPKDDPYLAASQMRCIYEYKFSVLKKNEYEFSVRAK